MSLNGIITFLFITDSIIERISLPFAKRVLKISPPIARRKGWNKESSSGTFYIKFASDNGRNEVRKSTRINHSFNPLDWCLLSATESHLCYPQCSKITTTNDSLKANIDIQP